MRRLKSIAVTELYEPRRNAAVANSRYRQLSLFSGAGGLGAAVTFGEFFDATGRVHEFLFTGEKRMTSGADADSNITTSRARVIYGAASADKIGLVIFRMNVRFHVQKGSLNLPLRSIGASDEIE